MLDAVDNTAVVVESIDNANRLRPSFCGKSTKGEYKLVASSTFKDFKKPWSVLSDAGASLVMFDIIPMKGISNMLRRLKCRMVIVSLYV